MLLLLFLSSLAKKKAKRHACKVFNRSALSCMSTGTSYRVRGDFKGRSGDGERKGGSSSPSAVSNASLFSRLILKLMFPHHKFFIYNRTKVNNK